jgi:hypothetical protein
MADVKIIESEMNNLSVMSNRNDVKSKGNKIKRCVSIQSLWRGFNYRSKKVLEPCNINELGIDFLELKQRLIQDYLTPGRMKYYQSTSTGNLTLEDGFMEFITAECINGKHVGEGHCPIDVIMKDKGIDVLCVCLNEKRSNEKSLTQNFKESSNKLEDLFKSNKLNDAIYLYKNIWTRKLNEAKKKYKLTKLYYLGFISTNKNIYISCFKINIDAIVNIKHIGLTSQGKSINFENVIDETYGTTKLYQSKKRMEIRFKKELLDHFNTKELLDLNDIL